MDERIIRGVRVIYERNDPKPPQENLRYTIDVFDERENFVEVLGRVADLAVANGAFRPRSRSFRASASSYVRGAGSSAATTTSRAASRSCPSRFQSSTQAESSEPTWRPFSTSRGTGFGRKRTWAGHRRRAAPTLMTRSSHGSVGVASQNLIMFA